MAPVTDHRPFPPAVTRATDFYKAVVAAGQAPSIGNVQPWRWRLAGDDLDLFVESSRMPEVTDAEGRLAVISCGAALHHARLSLAAHGRRVTVTRLPDADNASHLARLHTSGQAPVTPATARLARAIRLRHTDSRTVTGPPVAAQHLAAICTALGSQNVGLHVLRPDQILGLTVAASRAHTIEPAAAQWRDELALWAGGDRIVGTSGERPHQGRHGEHDRAATFVVLYGPTDRTLDWLHAGEALSAGWLVATELGISMLPFSAPIQGPEAWASLRREVADLGHPYLAIRLGHHTSAAVGPYSQRLPPDQIIERISG
jgi:nitroreductase